MTLIFGSKPKQGLVIQRCSRCGGSGEVGRDKTRNTIIICPGCHGSGRAIVVRQKGLTMLTLEMCKHCQGTGYLGKAGNIALICQACGGLRHVIHERASIFDGQYFTVRTQ